MDAHHPQRWLPRLAAIRPGWFFIHAESVQNPRRFWRIFALSGQQDWRLTRQRRYCPIVIWHLQLDALMIMTSEPTGAGGEGIAMWRSEPKHFLLRNAGRTRQYTSRPHGCLPPPGYSIW
ncbi:hypothetical protein KCP69_16160 [Salmonella enterica subsp. enterica]|nr:hypothetical protein KCP69_16160 [Salmonella enterica subsp. enterica]